MRECAITVGDDPVGRPSPLWVPNSPNMLAYGQARGPAPTVTARVNAGPLWFFVMY